MPRRQQDKKEAAKLAILIGGHAREQRTRLGWTQEQAAERVDLSTESYGRIERGHSLPSFVTFMRLCREFGASPNVLLGHEPRSVGDEQGQRIERLSVELAAIDQEALTALEPMLHFLRRSSQEG